MHSAQASLRLMQSFRAARASWARGQGLSLPLNTLPTWP